MIHTGGAERAVAYVAMFIIGCTTLGWTCIMLQPSGWHRRMSPFYTFDIGLNEVELGLGAGGQALRFGAEAAKLDQGQQDQLRKMTKGKVSLHDIAERMCVLDKFFIGVDLCGMWTRLRVASIFFAIVGWACIICHGIGGFFLYMYWVRKPTKMTRKVAFGLLAAAPCIQTLNVMQYVVFTLDLVDFPPRTAGSSWGVCLWFAMMLTFFMYVPLVLASMCAKKAVDEGLRKAQHNLKEAELDAKGQIELARRMENWRPGDQLAKWKHPSKWTGEQSHEVGYAANAGYVYQGQDNPQQPQYSQYSQQQQPQSWGCGPMPAMQPNLQSASADVGPYAAHGGQYGHHW